MLCEKKRKDLYRKFLLTILRFLSTNIKQQSRN